MNEKITYVRRILSGVFALIIAIFTPITQGIDTITEAKRCETAKTNIVGLGAYFHSQGMATDGESFFFSSKTTLVKTDSDFKTITKANYFAIPKELSENYSIKHIGGMSYYNGKIYAGLEDSKQWHNPIIGVYDAETLELTEYYRMNPEVLPWGVPWVTVDPVSGLLYCGDSNKDTSKLLVYDTADEMRFVCEIPLGEKVNAIQGGEFFRGSLLVATNDATQAVFKIDPATGGVEKAFDRNLVKFSEGEGMTVTQKDGKPILLAMDMGPLFVNAFVREYDLEKLF